MKKSAMNLFQVLLVFCTILTVSFSMGNALAETAQCIVFDDDASVGMRFAAWSGATAELDSAVVKEGKNSLKIQYAGGSGQTTAAFFFEPVFNITPELRETSSIQFWYYSDGVIPSMDIALTYQTPDDHQSEIRVPLKEGYVSDATGEWQLVQIPLSVFGDQGKTWDAAASAFVDAPFDYSEIKSLVFYAHTRDVAEPAPVYLDAIAFVDETAQPEPAPAPAQAQAEPQADDHAWYVSPNGSDSNDGRSPDRPLKTVQQAANRTVPGDTVYLMGGTYENYKGSFLSIKRSGTEDAYITYRNYPGETPVIISGNNVWDTISITASYIKVEGLTMIGLNDEIDVEEGAANYEAYIKKQDTGIPYDEYSMARTNTNAIVVSGRPATARGYGTPHHIEIRNCDISKFPQCGIGVSDSDYIIIENNHIHENMYYSLFGSSGISILGSVDIDDNTWDYKNIIRNNVVWGNRCYVKCQNGRKWSDGNGIIIDYNKNTGHANKLPYRGKTLIENNLVYLNGGGGIHIFNSSNVDVISNTSYNNGQTPELSDWGNLSVNWATNVKFINNITVACALGATPISYGTKNNEILIANNIYYNTANPGNDPSKNGGPRLPAQPGILVNNIWADPGFVNPEVGDFHLLPDSPAVDAGITAMTPAVDLVGDPRPQGAAMDIGTYESPYENKENLAEEIDLVAMIPEKPQVEEADAARGTPDIDGEMDDIWENTQLFVLGKYVRGEGAHGTARVMWNDHYLYALVEVIDPRLTANSDKEWNQDSVEFFIDENHAKTVDYEKDDAQYRVNIHNKTSGGSTADLKKFVTAVKTTENGYVVEAAIPFRTMKPITNTKIGFDIQINDEDESGDATASICKWSDPQGSTFQDTSAFGDLLLVDVYLHKESDDETVIKVTVDGKQLEEPGAVILEGKVMIPVQLVKDALGLDYQLDEADKSITVKIYGAKVRLPGVVTVEDTLMIPARVLEDRLAMRVNWLPSRSLLEIKTK